MSRVNPDFKYIAKIPVGRKYRYFYDEAAYKAFLAKGKAAVDKVKSFIAKTERTNSPTSNSTSAPSKFIGPTQALPGSIKNLELNKNQTEELREIPEFMSDVPRIVGKHSKDDDMAAVNEKFYDEHLVGDFYKYSLNCMFTTTAYELRRRGYDVEAAPIEKGLPGYHHSATSDWFENPKSVGMPTSTFQNEPYSETEMMKQINKNFPPGSRGNMIVTWKKGGGHSMVYELTSSGALIIRDAQINKTIPFSTLLPNIESSLVMIRTDNLKLKKGVRNVIVNN